MIWTLKIFFRGSFEDLHVLELLWFLKYQKELKLQFLLCLRFIILDLKKRKPHLKAISRANINSKRV